ncbi:DUF3320 domain-containing protein [Kocuria flava]|uniref:DUF3320 domain-containing protein n=1 Tax=Kocuria flava TaxID=446860 RepID=UPI0024856FEF|nr:DUF3320 domain-containing protein [Kocuria flava]
MKERTEVAAALEVWREGLVNLSGVNRLIKFKASKSGTVAINRPDPQEILSGLSTGTEWKFQGAPDRRAQDGDDPSEEDDESTTDPVVDADIKGAVLHSPRPEAELGAALRNLMRKANAEYLDRGLTVLYVALGMLHWEDVDGTSMSSPLLLVPVELHPSGPKGTPTLTMGEDDVVLNPALTLRMRELGVTLPDVDTTGVSSVDDLLESVRRSVRQHAHWGVEPTVLLSTFSFHKEAMYRDLLDNEELVLAHPVVQALGTRDPASQSPEFIFDPIPASDIDHQAPPEDMPLVLDADSSQRASVAAAVAGKSFVMDGPPGTGKSQTIANMIGALLHAGKSVLFVSEKAAALEVVRNRLADAGLENYLLELHSHKASRKEVALSLAKALDTVPVPPQGMDSLSRTSVTEQRQRLNAYAEAMNEVRSPLGMSLHQVIGLLSHLVHAPAAPMPELPPAGLSQADYQTFKQTVQRLQRAWGPAEQGSTYLWREVLDPSSLEIRLYQANSALEELEGVTTTHAALAASFGLARPSEASTLVTLLEEQHVRRPPEVLDAWLTTADWDELTGGREKLGAGIGAVVAAEKAFLDGAGVPWTAMPAPEDVPGAPSPIASDPAPIVLGGLTAASAQQLAAEFEAASRRLEERLDQLRGFAQRLGVPPVETYEDADGLLGLVALGFETPRPHQDWLTREGHAAAAEALAALEKCIVRFHAIQTKARQYFTDEALNAPMAELHDRFVNVHKGLKKLSGAYRADKRAVTALLNDSTDVDSGIDHLHLAIAWGEAADEYETAVKQHSEVLGPYWRGAETDFVDVAQGLQTAQSAMRLVREGDMPSALVRYLAADEPSAAYRALVQEITEDLEHWKRSLRPAPALAGRPDLLLAPISSSTAWLDLHVEPLKQTAARVATIDAAVGRAVTLVEAERLLALHSSTVKVRDGFDRDADAFAEMFGGHYRGVDTDLAALDDSLAWAARMRSLAGGPLTASQVEALATSSWTDNLAPALEKWTEARGRIVQAFAEERHAELLSELDEYRNAAEFIRELQDDSAGQDEWFTHVKSREQLAALGLDAAVEFCVKEAIPSEAVADVVERALLRSWVDHAFQSDDRLEPFGADDRYELVARYQDLDKELILNAASDIMRAVNARRPSMTAVGEPGVIRREGMKKSRHLSVRELIARTRNTALAVKPCFMMSPLAVSQYLPPDMNFDVVIFDEASQVTPGDSINCIYRGKALILAGDDKQLPPTSFFERVGDDEGDGETDVSDFQSVLELAKGCGAFNNLGLKWHYRSRHEDLIAFSNQKFYDSNLVTYPSAQTDGSEVGVEFFHAEGVYRRGGGADNPLEAAMVADRVIDHFTNRPHLTLGVVTFSTAQAEAIYDALDKARETRRDLDRFFDNDDRLHAFFIKSLESVQGDERDVIIFSIGYGPDEAGKITTNFGVLNKPKGWRRLNVAITRARQRVEVVASLRAGNIPPSENESVEHLRAYLDYAERGRKSLAVHLGASGLGPESPFEESVVGAIRSWGYVLECQVGAAGYRIDIGVRHPERPGTFALGVECDGYQYHSAPAARDRDRLREQVLQGLGWRLHRIWGTAWYRDRKGEEERLRAAIEKAVREADDTDAGVAPTRLERPQVETAPVEHSSVPSWSTEYVLADVGQRPRWADPAAKESRSDLASAVQKIAEAEGPVHIDLIHHRLRSAWGIGRIGYRVRDNIDAAIELAEVVRDGAFVDLPNRPVDRVRVPANGTARKVEQIHDDELRLACVMMLRDAGAVPREELITALARLFGWYRTGVDISRRLAHVVAELVQDGEVTEDGEQVTLHEDALLKL